MVHSSSVIFPLDESDPDDIYSVERKDYFWIHSDRCDTSDEDKVLSDDLNERYEKWKKHAYHWQVGCKLFRTAFLRDNEIYYGDIRLSEDMSF